MCTLSALATSQNKSENMKKMRKKDDKFHRKVLRAAW